MHAEIEFIAFCGMLVCGALILFLPIALIPLIRELNKGKREKYEKQLQAGYKPQDGLQESLEELVQNEVNKTKENAHELSKEEVKSLIREEIARLIK